VLQRLKVEPLLGDVFVVLQRAPVGAGVVDGPIQADAHVHRFDVRAGLDDLAASWPQQRRTAIALNEQLARQPGAAPDPPRRPSLNSTTIRCFRKIRTRCMRSICMAISSASIRSLRA